MYEHSKGGYVRFMFNLLNSRCRFEFCSATRKSVQNRAIAIDPTTLHLCSILMAEIKSSNVSEQERAAEKHEMEEEPYSYFQLPFLLPFLVEESAILLLTSNTKILKKVQRRNGCKSKAKTFRIVLLLIHGKS